MSRYCYCLGTTYILCVSVEYNSPKYKSLISVRAALVPVPEEPVFVVASLSSKASSAVCTSHCRESSLSVLVSFPIPPMYSGEFWIKNKKIIDIHINATFASVCYNGKPCVLN